MMPANKFLTPIVVTGRGIVSAIGTSISEFSENLLTQHGGIALHDKIFSGKSVYAGIAGSFQVPDGLDEIAPDGYDKNAKMAASAIGQALLEAGLWVNNKLDIRGERVALLLGTSHGGRTQLDQFVEAGMPLDDAAAAKNVLVKAAHHYQSALVATLFGVHGPVITTSTACSSSGSAIAHGIELLRSGAVDVVIAGGADAFSKLTYSGFAALGAVADGPCGPFGSNIGMTLGEGAAFMILERSDTATARGAVVLAELFGCASSWDAHHLTAPEPSGKGMYRAITDALSLSGLQANQIDYINAHATGTRANDISETLAIKHAFETIPIPPISATKSFTGHTLGASSVMGFLVGVNAMQHGSIPPTLNFSAPRPGCDLDYVPNIARPAVVKQFLAQSAAFGGANCVIAGGVTGAERKALATTTDQIVITGMGLVSPLGHQAEPFFSALLNGQSAARLNENPESMQAAPYIASVQDFIPRRDLPPGTSPRMDRISQYAISALHHALLDAGMPNSEQRGKGLGLMVGLCRGAAASFESYLNSVRDEQWDRASPVSFPNLVMSSVGGKSAIALGIKGPASTIIGGNDVALIVLANAASYLTRRTDIDAIVVVVADELTPLYMQLDSTQHGRNPEFAPAEGAVAFVVERRSHALARSAHIRADVAGWAQNFSAVSTPAHAEQSAWQEQVMQNTLSAAAVESSRVDAVLVVADNSNQQEALDAVDRLFITKRPMVTALAGQTGVAEACGGFFAVAAAILALEQGEMPAPIGTLQKLPGMLTASSKGDFQSVLVHASCSMGSHSSVLLKRTAPTV